MLFAGRTPARSLPTHPASIPRSSPFALVRRRSHTARDLHMLFADVRRQPPLPPSQAENAGSIPVARSRRRRQRPPRTRSVFHPARIPRSLRFTSRTEPKARGPALGDLLHSQARRGRRRSGTSDSIRGKGRFDRSTLQLPRREDLCHSVMPVLLCKLTSSQPVERAKSRIRARRRGGLSEREHPRVALPRIKAVMPRSSESLTRAPARNSLRTISS